MKTEKKWMFVIDTDAYSGSFEREITAYITGLDTPRGAYYQELFFEEHGVDKSLEFRRIIEHRNVDRGDFKSQEICSIVPTDGMFNNGLGGHFKNGEELQAVDHYNNQHGYKNPKIITVDTLKKYPAFQSVGIFFSDLPSDKQLEFMSARAIKFSKLPKRYEHEVRPTILCCRLVLETATITEEIVWDWRDQRNV